MKAGLNGSIGCETGSLLPIALIKSFNLKLAAGKLKKGGLCSPPQDDVGSLWSFATVILSASA